MRLRVLFAGGLALALVACAGRTPPPLPPVASDAAAHQQQREAQLSVQPNWSMHGRVAVSNGKDGGSGRIDWTQHGAQFDVQLSAPITRRSWRLSGGDGHARLDGLQGGPREGDNAADLLLQATRWDIPVDALASWLRGARADTTRFGPADVAYGGDGRLALLVQDGWTIDYTGWQAATPDALELPTRLTAVREQAKVKLVVDGWESGSTPQ